MRFQVNILTNKILTNDPIIKNIRVSQGERFDFNIFCVNVFNYFFPTNLFGSKWFFTAKRKISDTDGNAAILVDVTSSPNTMGGQIIIPISPEQSDIEPGNYIYSIKVRMSDETVYKVVYGNLCIEADPTNRSEIYEA